VKLEGADVDRFVPSPLLSMMREPPSKSITDRTMRASPPAHPKASASPNARATRGRGSGRLATRKGSVFLRFSGASADRCSRLFTARAAE
jgi:hypothetical protein